MIKQPYWLIKNPFEPALILNMQALLDNLKLHTVCESALCPNQGECFTQGTVAFLILGEVCTRNCSFCAVKKGTPLAPSPEEPEDVSKAVRVLNLSYVVITSVTRDDLIDRGANQFAKVVSAIKSAAPSIVVELLVPDFHGSIEALTKIITSSPDVINHNVETVPRLYPAVRPEADYQRSIKTLKDVKLQNSQLITKSGMMLGLGEERSEVIQVLEDLRNIDCDLVTLGQYLPPSRDHYPLSRYVTPEEFRELEKIGLTMGFRGIASGPLVRSSFNAAQLFREAKLCLNKFS